MLESNVVIVNVALTELSERERPMTLNIIISDAYDAELMFCYNDIIALATRTYRIHVENMFIVTH